MVSRRNFAAITSMMLVVCFLFLLPQYWKAAENPYSQNIYVSEEPLPTASDRFRQPELTTQAALNSQQSYFAFLGDASGSTGYAVTTWAEYTKTPLAVFGHAADLAAMDAQLPRAVIVEGAHLELSGDLKPLLEQGYFCAVLAGTARAAAAAAEPRSSTPRRSTVPALRAARNPKRRAPSEFESERKATTSACPRARINPPRPSASQKLRCACHS